METAVAQKAESNSLASKFVRGSTAIFAGRVISLVLKFFIQVLIVRYLSKSDFGAFAYALNMVDIAQIVVLIALDNAAARFIPIYDEQKDYDSLFGFIILSLVSIIGLGAATTLFFIAGRGLLSGTLISDDVALSVVIILIALGPLEALDSWFQSLFAGFGTVRAIFFRRYILWPMLQMIAVVIVLLLRSDVYWLSIGYLVGGAMGTVLYGLMSYNLLRRKKVLQHFHWKTIKFRPGEIFGFSVPMFLTGLGFLVRSQLAIVLLAFFRGTVAVAEYRAVQPVVALNSVVYTSFALLYLPVASRLFARKDTSGINKLFWQGAAWIAITSFPVFLVTFSLASPLVKLLFGEQYASSAIIMTIAAFGTYFNSVMGFNKDTLRAYNKVKYLMFVDFTVVAAALISFFVFMPVFGAVGAAISYTLAIVFNNILYHIGLVKHAGIKVFEPEYLPIYTLIAVFAAGLSIVQWLFSPSLFITVPLAAVLSLIVLRVSAPRLQMDEYFPELSKVPVLKNLLHIGVVQKSESGVAGIETDSGL